MVFSMQDHWINGRLGLPGIMNLNKYPLYKVYMGLISKVAPISREFSHHFPIFPEPNPLLAQKLSFP